MLDLLVLAVLLAYRNAPTTLEGFLSFAVYAREHIND